MVDLALSSMALAIFSRTQKYPAAAIEASLKYYRLLRVTRKWIAEVGIRTLDEQNIDACLLAIILMSRYEGATQNPGDVNSENSSTSLQNWSAHQDGGMAVLKIWNDNLSHNPATFIIKQARRGLIKASLLRNVLLPDWILNGNRFGEYDLELDYDRIIIRVVNLRSALASLQQKNVFQIIKIEELNNEARELDKALQDWAAQFPGTWSYQQHILTEPGLWLRRHFYSSTVYSYSRLGHAAFWSQYFATRMLINNIRLRILGLNPPNSLVYFTYEHQRLESITQLKAMADSLASTIPFCLERFKVVDNPNSQTCQTSITLNKSEEIKPSLATLVVWPLTIASSLEAVSVEQQLWFRSELAMLGRITGDGALVCAETDQWAML